MFFVDLGEEEAFELAASVAERLELCGEDSGIVEDEEVIGAEVSCDIGEGVVGYGALWPLQDEELGGGAVRGWVLGDKLGRQKVV